MAVFISIIVLIGILIFAYLLEKNFLSPRSLLIVSFLIAMSLIFINQENWEVTVSSKFFLYCFTAIVFFFLGCLLIRIVFYSQNIGYRDISFTRMLIFNGHYPYFMMAAASLLCSFAYIFSMIRGVGLSGGITTIFRTIYTNAVEGESGGFLVHQMNEIVIAIAKISVFEMCLNRYLLKKKSRKSIWIPIACFVICALVSTDRNIFIRFALYWMSIWIMFYLKSSNKNMTRTNWKVIRKCVVIGVAFLLLFYGLGKLKNYTSNFERMIGIYGGSGLYNFKIYLDHFTGDTLNHGKSTFSQLIATLQTLKILGGTPPGVGHGQMIVIMAKNGYIYESNIYSAMKPYLDDFGYYGMMIFPFILGMIYQGMYLITIRRGCGFSWVFYALMMYPLIYFSIQEQFFLRFHLGMVYEIGWVCFFYFIIYGKNGLWRLRIRY